MAFLWIAFAIFMTIFQRYVTVNVKSRCMEIFEGSYEVLDPNGNKHDYIYDFYKLTKNNEFEVKNYIKGRNPNKGTLSWSGVIDFNTCKGTKKNKEKFTVDIEKCEIYQSNGFKNVKLDCPSSSSVKSRCREIFEGSYEVLDPNGIKHDYIYDFYKLTKNNEFEVKNYIKGRNPNKGTLSWSGVIDFNTCKGTKKNKEKFTVDIEKCEISQSNGFKNVKLDCPSSISVKSRCMEIFEGSYEVLDPNGNKHDYIYDFYKLTKNNEFEVKNYIKGRDPNKGTLSWPGVIDFNTCKGTKKNKEKFTVDIEKFEIYQSNSYKNVKLDCP